ncbi:MAG: RagB/SusD family nutrient uptake outer membrane protein [Tannerella sp.]|jgi:hypothetical protein|nr:RagB/SusD family nutrient uptake outer membrane protein [Tannerella sp.]
MKKYLKNINLLLSVLLIFATSCNDYLDEAPDNRTELDTKEKISSFLISGYSTFFYPVFSEMMSDNADHKTTPTTLSYSFKWQEDAYLWADTEDEQGNDSPKDFWVGAYQSIAAANQALAAIEQLGNPADLAPQRGEALLIRAYYHFCLINIFALNYSEQTSATDLGLPYATAVETTVNPTYERGNVADFYAQIERDLEEGLPLIDDNAYTVPKYHFNRAAAHAFAARFYLFYRKYDKVIENANAALGNDLSQTLRDLTIFPTLSTDIQIRAGAYVNPAQRGNFLLHALHSQMSTLFANYTTGKLYQHSYFIALNETTRSSGPWRPSGAFTAGDWYLPSSSYASSNYNIIAKIPYDFEYTDVVAGTGFQHSTYAAFYGDETLLCRAEAYILKEQYDLALNDLAAWYSGHIRNGTVLTRESLNQYYDTLAYYTPGAPTPKKALNPEFPIVSREQENFLHCLLHFRRIETLHEGLRWFDVKRYGIVIYRRDVRIGNGDELEAVTDSLTVDDPRRAMQLPADVINAGLRGNPR